MMTDSEMREAVRGLFTQEPDDRMRQAIERLTQGRPLDEHFTDLALSVLEEDLMTYEDFSRQVERDHPSGEFLSDWVVVSRPALRNILRLVVRDAIGMTDNLDSVRKIVREMGLRPSGEFRISEEDGTRTIWDDSEGIGLRFRKGERLSLHLGEIIIKDPEKISTEDGMRRLDETRSRLLSFARVQFPDEFGTEVH